MAKMFYKLEEAAAKLGVDESAIRQMVSQRKVTEYTKDGSPLFKKSDIDALAAGGDPDDSSMDLNLDDTGVPLAETGEISLNDTSSGSTEIPIDNDESVAGLGDTLQADPADESALELQSSDSTGIPLSETGNINVDLSGTGELDLGGTGELALTDTDLGGTGTGSLELAGTDEHDAVKLDDTLDDLGSPEDSRQATGVSVFDADEVPDIDPNAQTLVTNDATEVDELNLDSIGSGSGLLDLTREADETSLGPEIQEILPGEGSDTKLETAAGSSGIIEGAALETGESTAASSGMIEMPDDTGGGVLAGDQMPALDGASTTHARMPGTDGGSAPAAYDPVGNGLAIGGLFVACAVLVVGLIVSAAATMDIPHAITTAITSKENGVPIWAGSAAGVALLGIIVGVAVGKFAGGKR